MEAAASGKRRSFSQRVGTAGELAFRTFAYRHGLLATKVEEDFGIDFMCQVDLDHLSRDPSDIASTVIGACVRATSSTDGKVFLYQGDAANLLNSGTPLIFVLAHMISDPLVASVYHRVVDEAFIHELHAFVESGSRRLEVVPSDCMPEDRFGETLTEMVSYGYSERVRVVVAATRVNRLLPNTTVEVRTRADGRLTLVSTVDYFSLFERIDDDQERELVHAAFGAGEHVAARVVELRLRSEVLEYLRSMPQPLVFAGFSKENETELQIVNGDRAAKEPFTFRAIGTHFGYVHASGISLIMSRARSRDGIMVHETELFVDPLSSNVMEDLGSSADFYALGSAGARILPAKSDSEPSQGLDVGAMFAPLHAAADLINAWRTCAQIEGWPPRAVELKHFAEPEILNTVVGFAYLFNEPDYVAKLSFVLREVSGDVAVADLEQHPTTIYLPIIGNLADHTLVLHLTCDGYALLSEGSVVGFAFTAITSASCEARERFQKSTIYPEIVAGVTAPTLAVGVAEQGTLPEGLGAVQLAWEDWGDRGGD